MTTKKKIKSITKVLNSTALSILIAMASMPVQQARAIDLTPSSGCSTWKKIPIWEIPAGWMCFTIEGEGTSISSLRATWRTSSLCNWRIDWVIYHKGRIWWRDKGPTHSYCKKLSGERYRGSGYAPAGSTFCAELYDIGREVKIEAVCRSITN